MFTGDYYITRLVFQKALAFTYLIGFLVALHQFRPLLGEKGLLPVPQFIKLVKFSDFPSLFFLFPKDSAFLIFSILGIVLSLFALSGFSEKFGLPLSMLTWFGMWLIYLSFVNVGQTFYSFGWESMLLEAGFLAIFLGDAKTAVPIAIIFLLKFELFKTMFGAGLIKLRGDPCWRDLTCLTYHYETQPIPNPLSWFFHQQPHWFHKLGVLYNHFVELIVPFGYFAFQPIAAIAGAFTLFFHGILALSGNFAFLSFLTAVLAITTFPDSILARFIPITVPATLSANPIFSNTTVVIATILALLNIRPVLNLISPNQIMNTSYDPFHLVGSYGAFGSITRPRYEVIIEGTDDTTLTDATKWQEYEFIGKPGRLDRVPAQIAPYHLRLDWLMWFAAFSPTASDPWFIHFIQKLLQNDKLILSLLKTNPFPSSPPKYIRAERYIYHFTKPEEKKKTGNWWKRELEGTYLPPVSLKDPNFQNILKQFGW
ncbi:MAG: lipase maturation factor family protein [Patescibacteria group bacterium]|mgnify:CR=1 FL=1